MSIEEVARLYGINPDEYMKAMCSPKVKVGTEYVTKGQTVQQCEYAIAALTKAAFGRLFDWLVRVINRALGNDMPKDFFIGILGKYTFTPSTPSLSRLCKLTISYETTIDTIFLRYFFRYCWFRNLRVQYF